jgi:hypothetical protein
MHTGMREMRDPHPSFDMHFYHERYLQNAGNDLSPIEHYVTHGWQKCLRPHPLFWAEWYAKKYLGAHAHQDPFYHYVTTGWREGCNPNPLFDGAWYMKQASGGKPLSPDPLSHYIHVGGREFDPHPVFKAKYFLSKLAEREQRSSTNLLQLYFTSQSHISPCPLFDQKRFADDLSVDGMERVPALVAFLEGATNGLDPHPFFSQKYYRKAAGLTGHGSAEPLTHYLSSGWKEGHSPHPLFDSLFYAAQYPQAAEQDPLTHYLLAGQYEGNSPRPPDVAEPPTHHLPGTRHVLPVSRTRVVIGEPAGGTEELIGVFAHIFYSEMTEELIGFTNNINRQHCVIYISTDTPSKAREIELLFQRNSRHPFEIRIFENRGRDLAPMIVGYADRLREVTYGLHIHTKKSPHYADGFDIWRHYLLTETLGSEELVENILGLLANEGIGAVVPDHFQPIRDKIQWFGNFAMTAAMLSLVSETLTRGHLLDFPSGSMFWFRTDALRKLLSLDLQFYHFDPEQGQVDGTLAHAVERCILYFVEAAGYRWLVSKSAVSDRSRGPDWMLSATEIRRAANCIFPTDHQLGALRHYDPECTRFVLWTSSIQKPRINLLIPSVDSPQTYPGMAAALTVFEALQQELGDTFDARLITTDITPGQQYAPPEGFHVVRATEADMPGLTVVDAAQRYRLPLVMRENDILIATSWWSALSAFDCIESQTQIYGPGRRKLIYFIQDFEPGHYGWSTKYALAEQTYRKPGLTIPVFSNAILRDYFIAQGYYDDGIAINPAIDEKFRRGIAHGTAKEKILIFCAGGQAPGNGLPFLDMLAKTLGEATSAWSDWRFFAIGEDFTGAELRCGGDLEILGRLAPEDYAALASRAALAISLSLSPDPGRQTLELAEAGVIVLTNRVAAGNLSELHENIVTFDEFGIAEAASRLTALNAIWAAGPQAGWNAKPKADWFFGGRTNMPDAIKSLAAVIRGESHVKPKLSLQSHKRAS